MTPDIDPDNEPTQPPPSRRASPAPLTSLPIVGVSLGAATHPGLVRANNEDHYLVARIGRSLETLLTNVPEPVIPGRFSQEGYVLAVADGMGGEAAGEVASTMALGVAIGLALQDNTWNLKIDDETSRDLEERASGYFRQTDQALEERARADPALTGMGTTLTAAYSVGADLFVFHVGDSRAYLFREGSLRQLTHDQTMAQLLADAGGISNEAVAKHNLRHVLTNVMGRRGGKVESEFRRTRLEDGDRVLLCSDGLTEMVEPAKIAAIMARPIDPQAAASALVDAALEGGGRDNVTVIVGAWSIREATLPA